MSYELMASFEEWENRTRVDASHLDRPPLALDPRASWTLGAQFMTLHIGDGYTDNLARNGDKNGETGYPGIIKNCQSPCMPADDAKTQAGSTDSRLLNWQKDSQPGLEDLALLPKWSCLMRIDLKLRTPYFSRDDRVFYPTENPLKRDWVFHAPYLAASGLKGLLRWAWRMVHGADKPEEEAALFGVAPQGSSDETPSRQGALRLWPLFWRGEVGLEVINPQDRKTGAGTMPIKYEVVSPKAGAHLWLLLHNAWGEPEITRSLLPPLLDALGFLLLHGGLSAKKTAGWGTVDGASIRANAAIAGCSPVSAKAADAKKAAEETWILLTDEAGNLKPYDANLFTGKRLKELLGWSNSQLKDRAAAYMELQKLHAERMGHGEQEEKVLPSWLWNSDQNGWEAFASALGTCVEAKEGI